MAQVRLIFRVHFPSNHRLHQKLLAYVQWFSEPNDRSDPINMLTVKRVLGSDGERLGDVIELESVARFIQLIPVFGKFVPSTFKKYTSMELARYYYINSFADKQVYQSVY